MVPSPAPPKPLIVVTGATGAQGGSVVRYLLRDGNFRVRAITRDAGSAKALELKSLVAETEPHELELELVEADYDVLESLLRAFHGAWGVFAVTNYWELVSETQETTQGMNLVDAAKRTGVRHFVWSTMERTTRPPAPHWNSKAAVNAYLERSGVPWTSLYTVFYFENFVRLPYFRMKWTPVRLGSPLASASKSGNRIRSAAARSLVGESTKQTNGTSEFVNVNDCTYTHTHTDMKTSSKVEVPEDVQAEALCLLPTCNAQAISNVRSADPSKIESVSTRHEAPAVDNHSASSSALSVNGQHAAHEDADRQGQDQDQNRERDGVAGLELQARQQADEGNEWTLEADWPILQSDGPIGGFSVDEVGAYVLEAFKNPQKWLFKSVRPISSIFTPRELVSHVSSVSGIPVTLKEVSRADFVSVGGKIKTEWDELQKSNKEQKGTGAWELWTNMESFYKHDGNPGRDFELTKRINPSRKDLRAFVEANIERLVPPPPDQDLQCPDLMSGSAVGKSC